MKNPAGLHRRGFVSKQSDSRLSARCAGSSGSRCGLLALVVMMRAVMIVVFGNLRSSGLLVRFNGLRRGSGGSGLKSKGSLRRSSNGLRWPNSNSLLAHGR
jgi:hypothetical protein